MIASRLVLVLLGLAFVGHVAAYDFVSDDAFIALRYTQNLAQGNGAVYNPGERIEGFTSPLWVVGLAALATTGVDLPTTARLVGVLAALAAMVGTWQLARKVLPEGHAQPWALLPAAALAAHGGLACWAAGGLEAPLWVALVVGSLLATIGKRTALSATCAVACALVRPEGLIVAAILGMATIARSRRADDRRWIAWVASVAGTLGAALALRLVYYGAWLPNTYHAKTSWDVAQLARGVRYLTSYAADHESLLLLIAPLVWAMLRGTRDLRWIAITAVALWGGVVAVGGDGLPMYRFALAPLPLVAVIQTAALERLTSGLSRRLRPAGALTVAVVGAVAISWCVVHASPPERLRQYENYVDHRNVEIPRWTRVGLWFREHSAPEDSIAVVPIGAVGYYSQRPIHDMLGLTDRTIARREVKPGSRAWAGHEKHDGAYILSRRPTYVLLNNVWVTSERRHAGMRPFIEYRNRFIFERERDLYENAILRRDYRPRSERIGDGQYLHFFELRPELR